MSYPIPKMAADIFGTKDWDNAGLVFDRFAPDTSKEAANGYPKGYNPKKEGLERVRQTKREQILRQAMLARWRETAKAAGAVPFTLKTDWRFVSGVGRNTPFEVGFRFDRYGFATLPGSSVKGVARAYAWASGYDGKEEFIEIFGCAPQDASDRRPAQTGRAVFLDAMPVDDPAIELDIMNPHYPKYYQREAPPTNWQNPVPIYFLTVKAGVAFEFAVGWRGQRDDTLQALAKEWLMGGLTELGTGAKTNAGYGYFVQAVSTVPTTNQGASGAAISPKRKIMTDTGRLRREGKRIFIQDGSNRHEIRRDVLGDATFNTLPGDKTDVTYEYDEVEGKRRVWKVTKKPNLKGL